MIEGSVAPRYEVGAVVLPANIQPVQMTSDAEGQRPMGGGGVRQGNEGFEDIKVGLRPYGQDHATMADAVFMASLNQMRVDVLVKVEGMEDSW